MEDEEKSKLVKRYTRLAIVSGFLLAFFWPLGNFFFWIFLGAASYFAFLVFYYRPRPEKKFDYNSAHWQEPDRAATVNVSPKNVKLIIAVSAITLFGFLLILMIIGFATGDGSSSTTDDTSINENRALLSADPTNVEALTNVGNSFYATGDYDSALVYYDRVLTIDSKNSSGLYNKGLVLYQKKEYQKSMDLLRQCISLYPENTDALLLMGDNYYMQEQLRQALEWYQQAYNKGVRTSNLLNAMAYIYDVQNEKETAIRFYKETLSQDSSVADVYTRLAELEPNRATWYKKKAEAWK